MCRINPFCWFQTFFKVNVQDFLGTNGIKGVSWGYHGWYPKGIHEDVMGIDEFLNWIDMFISFHLVLCIFFSQSWEFCRECCRNCSIQNHSVSIQNAEFIPRPPIFHVPNLHRLPILAKQNLQKSHEIFTGPAYVSFLSFPLLHPRLSHLWCGDLD